MTLAAPSLAARRSPARRSPRHLRAVLGGALIVAILDFFDASIFFGLYRDVSPVRIFQSVAYSLLGKAAYDGGLATFAFGLLLHFCVALGIVSTYYLLSRGLEILRRRPVLSGLLYGVGAYFVMSFVIVPLTRIDFRLPSIPVLINGIVGHALLVGLPAALWVRRVDKSSDQRPHADPGGDPR